LSQIKFGRRPFGNNNNVTKLIMFKCPRTGLQVQTPLAPEVQEGGARAYEAIKCLACAQLHFVNRATGKVLGAS
jgi:hypothetical protein